MEDLVLEFKKLFKRDFPYCETDCIYDAYEDSPDCVCDGDIERAILESQSEFRGTCLKDPYRDTALLYLAAHNLIINLRNSNAGVTSSFSFLESSRSVGSVSVSNSIPESISKDPYLSSLFSTGYGAKYYNMIRSCIRPMPFVVCGRTTP